MTTLFEWLRDYQKLMQQIEYMEFKIQQSEREKWRWEQGDLEHTTLSKESIAADLINGTYIERDKELLEVLKTRRKDLINFISKFDDLDSRILKLKYVDGLSLYEIAEDLAYSYQHIRRCHSNLVKAIKLVDKHLLNYFEDTEH